MLPHAIAEHHPQLVFLLVLGLGGGVEISGNFSDVLSSSDAVGGAVSPELAGRELLPGHRGQALAHGAARHHEARRRVVHREGGVEDIRLVQDDALIQGIHGEQKSRKINILISSS